MRLLFIVLMFVSFSFSDNIIRRGVNFRIERLAATGDGSDTLPFTPGISIVGPIDSGFSGICSAFALYTKSCKPRRKSRPYECVVPGC